MSEGVDIYAFSPLQVSATEVSPFQISFAQISPLQVSATEVSFINYTIEGNSKKNRLSEVTTSQIALIEVSSAKVGLTQIPLSQIPTITSNSSQASLTQANATPITKQGTTTEIDPTQILSLKDLVVFFSNYPNATEISLQQHNAATTPQQS